MGFRIIDNVDWDTIERELLFTPSDISDYGVFIINRIIERILNRVVADGRPISENSEWWKGVKLREGKLTHPLQYTGGLTQESTYMVIQDGDTEFHIELEPSYTEIHRDLIDISDATGKNYKDFFAWNEDDLDMIIEEASDRLFERLQRLET